MIGYAHSDAIISQYKETMNQSKVTILTKGEEIDYFASEENSVFTIAIESKLFYSAFSNYFGQPFDLLKSKRHFQIHKRKMTQFHVSLISWMDQLQNQYTDNAYKRIETEVLGSIFDSLNISTAYNHEVSRFKSADIRKLLDESIYESQSISDTALQANLSERHMLRLFKETYNISPKAYLQKLRLNCVRKEFLNTSEIENCSISDIALKYNFYHMGHFSAEYKKMFGELPSITAKR